MDLRLMIPAYDTVIQPITEVVGDGDSGLSLVAKQLAAQDFDAAVGGLLQTVQGQLVETIPGSEAAPFAGGVDALGNFSATVSAVPDDLFVGIQGPLGEFNSVLQRLPEIIKQLTTAADAIDNAHNGDLQPIVQTATDGLNGILQNLTGPDYAGFSQWQEYLQELADALRPIVDSGADAEVIRDQLLVLAIGRIRDAILGLAPEMASLAGDAESFFNELLPDVGALNLSTLQTDVLQSLSAIQASAESDGQDLENFIADFESKMQILVDSLHGGIDVVQAALGNPLMTVGEASKVASRELDSIVATRVDDYSNVVERLETFFGSIEEAIDALDLSAITDGVNGFFGVIQSAVEELDPQVIETEVDGLAAGAEEQLDRVQEMVTSLTSRIQGWLGEMTGEMDSVVSQLGTFNEEGEFEFSFQSSIEDVYQQVDYLIQGNPNDTNAASIAGTLHDFQAMFTQLVGEIDRQLLALAGQLNTAKDNVASLLEDARAEIESVNPQAVMEEAKQGIESAFEAIGGLEFDPVVDPIIAELDKARDELSKIDLSSLNDIIKAALSAALDAIQTSNFDQEITQALLQELDEILAYPREALNSITEKLNELIDRVLVISPDFLMKPVQDELDVIVDKLDVDLNQVLVPPLNDVLDALKDALEPLNPAQFLQPLQDVFDEVISAVDKLAPETLLKPVQEQINALAATLDDLSLTEPLARVNSVMGDTNGFLDQMNPQELLLPVSEPFDAVFNGLQQLQPSVLLAPLSDIMDQIPDITSEIPDSLITTIRDLYDEALARADALSPEALFSAIRNPLEEFQSRWNQLAPGTLLTQIQSVYTQVQGSVQLADERDGTSLSVRINLSAPTMVFASVLSRYEPIHLRIANLLSDLDPAPLEEKYQQAVAKMEELLPRAIRDDITAGQLETLLGLTNPAQWITRLDEIYNRILGKLEVFTPATIIDPLMATYDSLRAALNAIDIGAIIQRIEDLVSRIGDIIASISLESILGPIVEAVDNIKAIVAGLSPAPLIAGLSQRFENLVDVIDTLAVDELVAVLQEAWDGLQARIEELFDLENLFAPIVEIFDALTVLLGGLDVGELIGVLDDKLDKIRDELEEALNRTGVSFKAMLAAVPVGGPSSASATIGGSI